MIINGIDSEQIYHTADVILGAAPRTIIERGLNYYQQGRVQKLMFHDQIFMEATVQGSRSYRVVVDLDFFFNSTCSCPFEGVCKHIVATVCDAISRFDEPELILLGGKVPPKIPNFTPSSLKKDELREADGPKKWVQVFDKDFPRFVTSHSYDLAFNYKRFFEEYAQKANNWSWERRVFYQLHLLLFCLQKLETKHSFYPSYHQLTEAFRILMDLFPALLGETVRRNLASSYPEEWKEWISALNSHVFSAERSPVDWLAVYRNITWHVLEDPELLYVERVRLETAWRDPSLDKPQKRQLRFALAHLDVISGQDESARDSLEPYIKPNNIHEAFFYLPAIHQLGQWNRLVGWLRWFLPYLREADRQNLPYVCRYWALWAQQQSSDEEWMDVLVSLLPRSFPFYSQYLLDTGRCRQWIDFHLREGYTPFHIDKDILKLIEAKELSSLLPLYHRAVEQSIMEKSRSGYKDAVKLLKKLRTYYKRLKEQKRWDHFILQLSDKYKRLRAFQEELRKGKLIS